MSEITRFFSKVDITDLNNVLRTVGGELMDMNFKWSHVQSSTLDMLIHNQDDTFRSLYPEGSKVELYFDTFSPPTTKRFTGIVEHAEPFLDVGKNYLRLFAREKFFVIAGQRLVAESYSNREISAIVKDIVGRYASEISTTTFVDTTPTTLEDVRFNYKTVKQCLDALATLAGFVYWVDANLALHFKQAKVVDSGITYNQTDIRPIPRFAKNIIPLRNIVYAIGQKLDFDQQSAAPGATFDSLETNYLAVKFTPTQANIKQLQLYLEKIGSPNDLSGEIREDKTNAPTGASIASFTFAKSYVSATGWYPITVDKDLDTKKSYWIVLIKTGDATNTYRWYRDAQVNQTRATSTDNTTWTVTGSTFAWGFKHQFGQAIISKAQDLDSLNKYTARETIIVDPSLTSIQMAKRAAAARLTELKDPRKEFQDLMVYGVSSIPNPSELVTVNVATIGLNEQVEVRELEFHFPGGWRGAEFYIARLGLVAEELKYFIADMVKAIGDVKQKDIDLIATTLNRVYTFEENFPMNDSLSRVMPGDARHPLLSETFPMTDSLSQVTQTTGTFVYGTAKYAKSDYA